MRDEITGEKYVDITDPQVFLIALILCCGFGMVIGLACSWLFYTTSHVTILGSGTYTAVELSPIHGSIMIIIMALTGLMIALTFHYVPMWVMRYYQDKVMPEWLVWIINKVKEVTDGKIE